MADDHSQHELIRERFTRTADQFASFSLAKRSEEAEHLVSPAAPSGTERALDLACGPGTFTRAFAARVRFIFGLDLTAALLERACRAFREAGLHNAAFARGDAAALPFSDNSLDLVSIAYSVHHLADQTGALREIGRVLRKQARLALVDLIPPEDAEGAALNNRIERARDASHTTTLRPSELRALVESAGLRITAWQVTGRPRSFDDWLGIAGWKRGDPAYAETRRLMETTLENNAAGFAPKVAEKAGAEPPDLTWVQTSAMVIAEKL